MIVSTVVIFEIPEKGPFASSSNGRTVDLPVIARAGHALVVQEARGFAAAQYWCGHRPTLTGRDGATRFFAAAEEAMTAATRWVAINDAVWADADGRYFERLASM